MSEDVETGVARVLQDEVVLVFLTRGVSLFSSENEFDCWRVSLGRIRCETGGLPRTLVFLGVVVMGSLTRGVRWFATFGVSNKIFVDQKDKKYSFF